MKTMLSLCAGRHETPASDSIFQREIPSILLGSSNHLLASYAEAHLLSALERAGATVVIGCDDEGEPIVAPAEGTSVDLYVTGLTPVLIAVLNAARYHAVNVTLYHFDRSTGGYWGQEVIV